MVALDLNEGDREKIKKERRKERQRRRKCKARKKRENKIIRKRNRMRSNPIVCQVFLGNRSNN